MLSNDTVHDCEVYGRSNGIASLAGICKSYRSQSQSQERARVSAYDTRGAGTLNNVMMKRTYLSSSSPFITDSTYGLYDLNVDQCSDGTQQDTYSKNNYQTSELTSRLRAGDRTGIDSEDPMGPQNRPLGTLNPMMDRTVAMEGNGMYSTYSGQNNSKALRNKSHVTGEQVARLQADAYTNSSDKDRGKASKNKPKSGGIYGLLLKSGIEGSEGCSQGQQKAFLSGNSSFFVDRSASIESQDDSSVCGTGLIKSSPNSAIGNQDDSPCKLSNRDGKGRAIRAISSHSSAQLLNSTFLRIADPTHSSPSDPTLKASSSSSSAPSGTGQVHQRPKSAFGRSSVGSSQHTTTSQSSSSQYRSNDSHGLQSMQRSHSVQKIHRDRDAAQDLRIPQSTPKIATWPSAEKVIMAGGGVGVLSKELSLLGTRPSTPNMKYSSSGRVAHAHTSSNSSSSASKSSRCSVDVREEEGEGVTKRPAVFKLLEHSVQFERERERAAIQGQDNWNGKSRPSKPDHQSLSSSAVDDDDESVMTLASIAMGEGLAAREGSVRQSLVLLKARKKSMTSTPRLSRKNSASTIPIAARGGLGCGQGDEKEQEQGPCDDNDGGSDDYSAHTSKNACSSSSKGSEHGSFDTSGAQSLDPWGASLPWSDGSLTSGAQSNKSTLPAPLSRDTYTNIDVGGAEAVPSTWSRSLSVSRSRSKDQQAGSSDARESAPALGRHQQSLSMHPCPHCGRSFASEPLNRHTKVCSRIFLKKRGVFDSVQMRGCSDGSPWGNISSSSSTPSVHKKNVPRTVNRDKGGEGEGEKREEGGGRGGVGGKWRSQSELFRESIKAVKVSPETGPGPRPGTPTGIGIGISASTEMSAAVTRIVDPTLVPCPHCCRR